MLAHIRILKDVMCVCENEEGNDMATVHETDYKSLRLSPEKLESISVVPKALNGKLLFDKNSRDHRYIVEDENNEA